LASARALAPDYFFPSRLHDQIVLEWALDQKGTDPVGAYGIGNFLYDRKRHDEAIARWEEACHGDPLLATAHRNLGVAYWNTRRDGEAARTAYRHALKCAPCDPRLLFEYDQLRKKLKDPIEERLSMLQANSELVFQRDDCTVEMAALYNAVGQPERALDIIVNRRFHPWEGGEGQVLRQYTNAHLLLGQMSLDSDDPESALEHFELAVNIPQNLGEAYHMLQAKADVNYWTGIALRSLGREDEALAYFESGANESGDFQAMSVTRHSELSYFRGLSLLELGREEEATELFEDLLVYAAGLLVKRAEIDYFATSLPLLLVFEDDLDELQHEEADRLVALAKEGLQQVQDNQVTKFSNTPL